MIKKIKNLFGKGEEEFKILLFEHINNSKFFKGSIKGIIKDDIKLGVHLHLPTEKQSIRITKNDAFFPSNKEKVLMVCKYAKDDYRIIRFLKQEEFYIKNIKERIKLDEKGKPIKLQEEDGTFILNENNEPIFETEQVEELTEYKEPLGASSDTREAMRFSSDFKSRLEEIHGEKKSLFEKLLVPMTLIILAGIFFAGMYMSNKNNNETLVKIADAIGEDVSEFKQEIQKPSFAQSLINKIENKNKEENAPPK